MGFQRDVDTKYSARSRVTSTDSISSSAPPMLGAFLLTCALFLAAWNHPRSTTNLPTTYSTHLESDAATYLLVSLPSAKFDIKVDADEFEIDTKSIEDYVRRSATQVSRYYGRYPLARTEIKVTPMEGFGVGTATATYDDRTHRGVINLRLAHSVTAAQLKHSWTLTHEMLHLAFPIMDPKHRWLAEGIATYAEPIARVRTGALTREALWCDLMENIPKGEPARGERGLNQGITKSRTYWGGALFCLEADIQLRKATHNKQGLEDALRYVLNHSGSAASDWSAEKTLQVADQSSGTRVLENLYALHKDHAVRVDVAKLWRDLGIKRTKTGIRFDDKAPLANIRKSIELGKQQIPVVVTSLSRS